jgi:hypothetical protein
MGLIGGGAISVAATICVGVVLAHRRGVPVRSYLRRGSGLARATA